MYIMLLNILNLNTKRLRKVNFSKHLIVQCDAIRTEQFWLCSDVILKSVNIAFREEDSVLDQINAKQMCSDLLMTLFTIIYEYAY